MLRGLSAPQCRGLPSVYLYTHWRWPITFDAVTHMGRELLFMWSDTPLSEGGRSPSASQFWGSPRLFIATRRMTTFNQVTRGEWRVSCPSATSPIPNGRSPCSAPKFAVPSMYVYIIPSTYNYRLRLGNTWHCGGRTCFRWSPTPSTPKGWPQWILWFSPTYAYTVWHRATNFTVVTYGEVRVLGVS